MCFRPGQAEQKLNTCPECGKVNKPLATECVNCGQKLEPPSQSQTPAAAPPRPGKPGGVVPPNAPPAPPKVPPAPIKKPEE
jgi:hypothetical protein